MLQLISILSFLLPTQLGFHFTNFDTTVYGFQIDYLIPTLYITDVVALLVIILGVQRIKFTRKVVLSVLLYIFFVLINLSFADNLSAAIYRWLKITEMVSLGFIILNTKSFNILKNFIRPLSYSVLIACILGILQFVTKGSLGGIFYWFGERSFTFANPNIAPYPYSFFSHPNSFAGFLLIFGILFLQNKSKFNSRYFWTLLSLMIVNLVLTNSLNVYITLVILLTLMIKNRFMFGFITIDFGARYITHRIELIEASWQMIKNNFLFGVGLNNFIPNLVKYSKTFVNSWELQPVHNIFLLVLSEVGIIGLVLFLLLCFSFLSLGNYSLLAILFTGLSDHYWLTLQQNILLFTYVVIISRKEKI